MDGIEPVLADNLAGGGCWCGVSSPCFLIPAQKQRRNSQVEFSGIIVAIGIDIDRMPQKVGGRIVGQNSLNQNPCLIPNSVERDSWRMLRDAALGGSSA
jgi:hypothetical protein